MHSFLLTVFTMSATLATAQLAHAAAPSEPAGSDVVDPCLEAAATTYEMGACVKAEGRRQERLLRRATSRLERLLSTPERQALRKAHAKWLGERAARCRAEASDFRGGSMMPLVQAGCMNEAARVRIAEYETRRLARSSAAFANVPAAASAAR